jgi:3-methyladenine DNA glycosylase AlkD
MRRAAGVAGRRTVAKEGAMAAKKTASPRAAARGREALGAVLEALEKAGTAQNRKIYARHGAEEPLFGVSFAELKKLVRRIGVDHELACALWETGNSDARTLAFKVADPARLSAEELERWVQAVRYPLLLDGVAQLAAEGPHALRKAAGWLRRSDEQRGVAAWSLVASLALRDESVRDDWFGERLAEIEARIQAAPNRQREAMNRALIAVGCRSVELRRAALAAAGRIGAVHVDHGETSCKTPEAAAAIGKAWEHAAAKGFPSPAAQERARENIRTRC